MSKGEHELTERDKNGNDVENKQERQPEVDHEQVDFMEGELDDAFWIEVLKAVPFSLKKNLVAANFTSFMDEIQVMH